MTAEDSIEIWIYPEIELRWKSFSFKMSFLRTALIEEIKGTTLKVLCEDYHSGIKAKPWLTATSWYLLQGTNGRVYT